MQYTLDMIVTTDTRYYILLLFYSNVMYLVFECIVDAVFVHKMCTKKIINFLFFFCAVAICPRYFVTLRSILNTDAYLY